MGFFPIGSLSHALSYDLNRELIFSMGKRTDVNGGEEKGGEETEGSSKG